jgi:hypothetical protein
LSVDSFMGDPPVRAPKSDGRLEPD